MKILICAPMSNFSGYGRDGIGMTQALVRAGHDVYLQPSNVQAALPLDIAMLLTKPLEGPFDLGIVHLDPGQMMLDETTMRNSCNVLVGWTMWEFTSLSNYPGRSKFRKGWSQYDALIGYDHVTTVCLKPYFSGPVLTVQGGFDSDGFDYVERDWHDETFFFGMIGVLSNRKNPWAAINAFSSLQHESPELTENARLILKTSGPGLPQGIEDVIPGVRVIYDVWNTEQVKDYYKRLHVLLAPSRGEGKNLPCLEMLSTGGGVIATNWGGHEMWMDEAYAYPIEYDLIPYDMYQKNTPKWADVHEDDLKRLMRHVLENRDEVAAKGKRGSEIIPTRCSWDAAVQRLFDELEKASAHS